MYDPIDPKTGAPLREHTFDGIQEYDNNLPLWWQALFYISLLWGVFYLVYFFAFPQQHSLGSHEADFTQRQEQLASVEVVLPSEEDLRLASADSAAVERGRAMFAAKGCVACHGNDGLGLVGPNLRDDLWLHGSQGIDLFTSLYEGRNNNMMPSQRNLMTVDEMKDMTAFLIHWNKTEKANGQGLEQGELSPIDY